MNRLFVLAVGLGCGILITALAFCAAPAVPKSFAEWLWSEKGAGWAQTAGTIVAIISSVVLVRWQITKQEKREAESRRADLESRVQAISELIRKAIKCAVDLRAALQTNDAFDDYSEHVHDRRRLEILADALSSFSWSQLPPQLMMPNLEARLAFDSIVRIAGMVHREDWFKRDWQTYRPYVEKRTEELRVALAAHTDL